MNLKNVLSLDEDVGSGYIDDEQEARGSLEVAPWISLQKSIPAGATIRDSIHRLSHERARGSCWWSDRKVKRIHTDGGHS